MDAIVFYTNKKLTKPLINSVIDNAKMHSLDAPICYSFLSNLNCQIIYRQ